MNVQERSIYDDEGFKCNTVRLSEESEVYGAKVAEDL